MLAHKSRAIWAGACLMAGPPACFMRSLHARRCTALPAGPSGGCMRCDQGPDSLTPGMPPATRTAGQLLTSQPHCRHLHLTACRAISLACASIRGGGVGPGAHIIAGLPPARVVPHDLQGRSTRLCLQQQ